MLFYRTFISIFLTFFAIAASAQQSSLSEQAKTNKRLLPKYGNQPKTSQELEADKSFIESTLASPEFKGDRRMASNYFIGRGFDYIYKRDAKTAMYRFNQAYLLDSTNTDIYWGYGAFYMTDNNLTAARQQYEAGLKRAPNSSHLLTDYATTYLAEYQRLTSEGKTQEAASAMKSAIINLEKSYAADSKDQNTLFKLSVCHFLKGDCSSARKYYDTCKTLGGKPITQEFTDALQLQCPQNK